MADRAAAREAVAALLRALDYDLDSSELKETPARVVAALCDELLSGERLDVGALIEHGRCGTLSDNPGIVVVRDLAIATTCPHHLMPAIGHATVAYLPGTSLLGLGVIARVVHAYARRLILQETLGESVTQALMDHAGARGAFCELELTHTCMSARGARETSARVRTVSCRGELTTGVGATQLALALRGTS